MAADMRPVLPSSIDEKSSSAVRPVCLPRSSARDRYAQSFIREPTSQQLCLAGCILPRFDRRPTQQVVHEQTALLRTSVRQQRRLPASCSSGPDPCCKAAESAPGSVPPLPSHQHQPTRNPTNRIAQQTSRRPSSSRSFRLPNDVASSCSGRSFVPPDGVAHLVRSSSLFMPVCEQPSDPDTQQHLPASYTIRRRKTHLCFLANGDWLHSTTDSRSGRGDRRLKKTSPPVCPVRLSSSGNPTDTPPAS
ncbi:hypothetical protein ACLOJK_006040 [Asimina triloba]